MEVEIFIAGPTSLGGINAVIEASKGSWGYDPAYLRRALPLLRVDARYLAHNTCFEARADGEVVGFAALARRDGLALLDHLWVAPLAQHRGIGRDLFDRCVEAASGATSLRIISDPPAEAFYVRLGAERVAMVSSRVAGGPKFPVLELRLLPPGLAPMLL